MQSSLGGHHKPAAGAREQGGRCILRVVSWSRWLVLAAAAAAGASPEPARLLRARYTPADAQTGRYQYLPFDVPAGATRVDVSLRYDGAAGGNVIDLGLLEPGPLELGTPAWRGWTGGARQDVFVASDDASPGCWPGPIPAGRWHVALGLYRVAEAGVEVVVEVRTSDAARGPAPPLPPRPEGPLRRGPAWYAGALHTHTVHSDGRLALQDLARRARAEGLDFLAVTDHNNTAHQREAVDVPGLLVIGGEEVTTPAGHANVWGLRGPRALVDFRTLAGDGGWDRLLAAAHAQGALVAINHPFADCLACSWTEAVPEGLDAIEVVNPGADRARAMALWDTLLRQGRRLTAVGASDWHREPLAIAAPSVRVWAEELSTPAVLDALRRGRVVVMADGATPPPELSVRAGGSTARPGDTLRVRPGEALEVAARAEGAAYEGTTAHLVWRGERVAAAVLRGGSPVRFQRWALAPGYLRLEVDSAAGAPLAVSNPVFIELAPAGGAGGRRGTTNGGPSGRSGSSPSHRKRRGPGRSSPSMRNRRFTRSSRARPAPLGSAGSPSRAGRV
jgi:hypothetical protein